MFVTQKLIDPKGEIDKFTVTVGVLNTPFSVTDRLSRQRISKDGVFLGSTIIQIDLINIIKPLHQTTSEDTFFSSSCETFSMTDHILDP